MSDDSEPQRSPPTSAEEPLQHIKVLEYVCGKTWKVEWLDPNPGLVDYVSSAAMLDVTIRSSIHLEIGLGLGQQTMDGH